MGRRFLWGNSNREKTTDDNSEKIYYNMNEYKMTSKVIQNGSIQKKVKISNWQKDQKKIKFSKNILTQYKNIE